MAWISRFLKKRPAPQYRAVGTEQPIKQPAPELSVALDVIRSCLGTGDVLQAERLLTPLLVAYPNDSTSQTYLGICMYMQGHIGAAKAALSKAVTLDAANAEAFKFYAACFDAERDDQRAVAINVAACSLNPDDEQVHCVAAALYNRIGDRDNAALHVNRALEINPESLVALGLLDQLAIRSTLHRSFFEKSPRVAEARARVQGRLLAQYRAGALGISELCFLLGSLQEDKDTFQEARRIALASEHHPDLNAQLAEQIASIAWAAGDGTTMLRMRELARQLQPLEPVVELALAHAKLMQASGSWLDSWRSMTRILVSLNPEVHPTGIPQWQGESLGAGKLLVYQDQGAGDALMAFRFLSRLKAKDIRFDLWVTSPLKRLASCLSEVDRLLSSDSIPAFPAGEYAAAIPLFGLISALSIPAVELRQVTALNLGGPASATAQGVGDRSILLHLGIVSGGNPMRRDDWRRSLALNDLSPLAALEGVQWTNLMIDQRDERAQMIEMFGARDPMKSVSDFRDTAELIVGLDAVVAIDSSVAHLAAALGKRVWVLAPMSLDWRWQIGDDTKPWWPNVELLRGTDRGFGSAIGSLVEQVEAFKKT
jgi:tetratricopeptide (TPR) repeat protein